VVTAKQRQADRRRVAERKVLLIVLFATVTPAIVLLGAIVISSRTDFFYSQFSGVSSGGKVKIIDWRTLRSPATMSKIVGSPVQLPGYMIAFGDARYGESTGTFLLVPDVGNSLHAPHLDGDEVVLVQMVNARKVRLLEREAVWVRGAMVFAPLKTTSVDSTYRLDASEVWPLTGGSR
jgi:hypothetical protein